MQASEGTGGGKAVGCVEAVGDGDPGYFGAGESVECEGLGGGIAARPEDEDAVGVGSWRGGGEAGGDELFGMDVVGGEKDVLRVAVEQLLGEGGGGAEGGDDLDAGGLLVGGCQCGQNGLEIGGGSDVEFFGSLRRRRTGVDAELDCEQQRKRCECALQRPFTVPYRKA